MKIIYTLILVLTTFLTANSQAGVLDPSFGVDGIVTTAVFGSYNFSHATVVQPDGKILVAGQAGEPATYKVAVVRYNTDGSLDTTFGNNGTLVIGIGSAKSFATDIALQVDDKIVLGAYTWNDVYGEFAAVRLNTDGTFDTSFGNQGIQIITTASSDVSEAVDIQADGKILLAGYSDNDSAILRLNTDGSIDTSFGVNGWAITKYDNTSSYIKDIEIQDDGKIVQAGFLITFSNSYEMIAARLNMDGTSDTTFGTDGKIRFNIGNGNDFLDGVAIQADGKILLGGHKWISNLELRHDFAVIRLNADGSFDSTYGNNGVTTAQIVDGSNYTKAILLQDDQKLLLTGSTVKNGEYLSALLRFDVDGSLDDSFGADGNGMVSQDFFGREIYGEALALQQDDKIIMAATSYTGSGTSEMVVLRYNNEVLSVNNNLVAEFRLFPNPATEYMTIELSDNSTSFNLEIIDLLGKKVYSSEVNHVDRIDVSQLANGTYFVKLNASGKSDVVRFVKK